MDVPSEDEGSRLKCGRLVLTSHVESVELFRDEFAVIFLTWHMAFHGETLQRQTGPQTEGAPQLKFDCASRKAQADYLSHNTPGVTAE